MRLPRALPLLAAAVLLAGGCGRSSDSGPVMGVKDSDAGAAQRLGFPGFATKNTTRVAGHDPVADAAAVARAVFPAESRATRPAAVALADGRDWRAALVASVLMSPPLRAPLLLADGDGLPDATRGALDDLNPRGSGLVDGAKVIRVGDVPKPEDLRSVQAKGANPFALAAAVDRVASVARGTPSPRVVVVGVESPEFATREADERTAFFEALGLTGSDTLVPRLEQMLISGAKPRSGAQEGGKDAALALAWLGTPAALAVLARELESKRPTVRDAVAQALEAVRKGSRKSQ